MKTLTVIAAIGALMLSSPSLAIAKDVTGQLTQTQIDRYCAGKAAGRPATFDLGAGKRVTGTVDCAANSQPKMAGAEGADDNGTESANDADSSHED